MEGLSRTRFVVTSVPWDNTYRHAMWFGGSANGGVSGTTARRNAYFESLPKAVDVSDFNLVKFGSNYVDVNRNFDTIRQQNYIWWVNAQGSTGTSAGRPFYAFITGIEVLNTRVTRIYYELDILQSFGVNIRFQQSVIEREHQSPAQMLQNVEPEGLNIGSEYVSYMSRNALNTSVVSLIIVARQSLQLPTIAGQVIGGQSGTALGRVPDPLVYYAIPYNLNAPQATVTVRNHGFTQASANLFMRSLTGNGVLASVAANNIVNMYIVPGLPFTENNVSLQHLNTTTWDNRHNRVSVLRIMTVAQNFILQRFQVGWRLPNVGNAEKIHNYPYSKIVITDNNGGVLELKPDLFNDRNRMECNLTVTLGPTPVMAIWPINYGSRDSSSGINRPYSMSQGMVMMNQNDLTIPSDMLGAFIQGNKNQLKAQQASWAEDLKYKQAVRSHNFWHDQFNNYSSLARGGINLGMGIFDAAAGVKSLGVFGDVQRGTMQAIDAGFQLAGTANEMARGRGNNQMSEARYNEEYAQKVRGLMAQKDDISNLPPNITKANNHLHFMIQNSLFNIQVFNMCPRQFFIERIIGYWHYYGTAVNRFGTPNLTRRRFWNYIKMAQCNVTGAVPEVYLSEVRRIFEAGITLWQSDMYNYNRTNS